MKPDDFVAELYARATASDAEHDAVIRTAKALGTLGLDHAHLGMPAATFLEDSKVSDGMRLPPSLIVRPTRPRLDLAKGWNPEAARPKAAHG
jgi:hypothetical protein